MSILNVIKKTDDNCLWADAVEINVLSRSIPHLGYIIFNDECSVINKIEQNKENKQYIYLLRQHYHYQSIQISEMNKKRILKLMKKKDNYYITKNPTKTHVIQSFIFIPLWIILFQFFNHSL